MFDHLRKNSIFFTISRCSAVGSAPVSGTGGLEFESPHFDQKEKRALVALFSFLTGVSDSTSLALCATGVRISNEAAGKLVVRW